MLKGISPLIGPDLLATLDRMGHGDAIVLADAHFPGEAVARRILRADGAGIPGLLDAILRLVAIDTYIPDPVVMMAAEPGDTPDPRVEAAYRGIIDRHAPNTPAIVRIDRHRYYERARSAFAVVMTSDTATYGNLLITKSVTPVE